MDEAYIEGLQKKISEIDGVLQTKNLTPLMADIFLRLKDRLNGAIQSHVEASLKQELQIAADKRVEKDSGALVGESLKKSPTVGQEGSTAGIRQFHKNLNEDFDFLRIPPWSLGAKKKTSSL